MRRTRGNVGKITLEFLPLFFLQHHVQQRLLRWRSTPRRILPTSRSVLVGLCGVLNLKSSRRSTRSRGLLPPTAAAIVPGRVRWSTPVCSGRLSTSTSAQYRLCVSHCYSRTLGVALIVRFSCIRQQPPPQQKSGGGGGGGLTACLAGMCLCCCAEGACSCLAVIVTVLELTCVHYFSYRGLRLSLLICLITMMIMSEASDAHLAQESGHCTLLVLPFTNSSSSLPLLVYGLLKVSLISALIPTVSIDL